MSTTAEFDLLLKGGRVIDPAAEIDGRFDVAISKGRIAALAPDIANFRAAAVTDVTDRLVLPGLIDTHAHVYQYVTGEFGLDPDLVGVNSGVASVVDQGGASALTFDGFRKFIVERAETRVLSFISCYLAGGLWGHKFVDLYGPHGVNVDAVVRAVESNRDLVRGIKSHAEPGGYSRWGTQVLALAKQAARVVKLPVYVHLGTLWPEKDGKPVDRHALVREVAPLLDEGDILAHPFTRHPSGFVGEDGKIHPLVFEAVKRGVRIDVGRGSHFSIATARVVLDAGILPFTLGGDMHGLNVGKTLRKPPLQAEPPTFSLFYAMSEMLALGVPLLDVVRMVTSNAATMLGEEGEIGTLRPGTVADVSVLREEIGSFRVQDTLGVELNADRRLRPDFMLRAGRRHDPHSVLLPEWERRAA